MKWSGVPALALTVLASGCSGSKECQPRVVETEQECKTTAECVEAGFKSLTCVNGTCGRTCETDSDCAAIAKISDDEKRACPDLAKAAVPTFVCEDQRCRSGCPDVPCASGETCSEGRCELYGESFEDRPGLSFVSFATLGWNAIDRELDNDRSQVVFTGVEGCPRGDEKCAGPAADGVRFAIIERRPTPAESTTIPTSTCWACACCRECLLAPPSSPLDLASCPGREVPSMAACPTSMPAVCADVCGQCDQCASPDPAASIGRNLLACELKPAMKTCTSCQCVVGASNESREKCNACKNADQCEKSTPESPTCAPLHALCDEQQEECGACGNATRCDLETPGSSECTRLHGICDAQGADGCFPTPIDRPRSALTDDEQALESPAINLASATGEPVLEVDYVPFNVGEQYRRVVQGSPAATWPLEPQELLVQLCGRDCAMPGSWVDAKLVSGARAVLPRAGERRNGLRMGAQSSIDWNAGRIHVAIPAELRTSELRFRFVPHLADGVRVGIDAVRIRRLGP